MKRAFLQHPAILVGENHVEEEIEVEISEKYKSCDQSPKLKLVDDEIWIEVELKG